ERFFGDIPPGPTVDAVQAWVPQRSEDTHAIQYDDVPAIQANRVWAVPPLRSRESAMLDLAAQILGGGRNARLTKELVHDRQVATSAEVGNQSFELMSEFPVQVTLKPDQPISVANEAMDRAIAQFIAQGPTRDEMARAVSAINGGFIRSFETGG